MREREFRAKPKKEVIQSAVGDGWVYGYYFKVNTAEGLPDEGFILTQTSVGVETDGKWNKPLACTDVVLETVGQFTGLIDINGKKIFEGDIAKYRLGMENLIVIKYHDGCFDPFGGDYFDVPPCHLKIVGNIHDHPHLLEGKPSAAEGD